MILPEERILQSQDPVPENLNDWPDFTLTDAKVRVPGSLTYANLLEARPEYPLSITGRLSRLDKQRERLVKYPKYTDIQLRIDHCTQYAFGQDPSGKSVIWAAGKAGWFEVVPSTRYTSHYEDIVKAIDLIYFLSDAHKSLAKTRPVRGAKVQELLGLYQQHTDFRVDDDAEAEAVFEKYHSFLIRQMLEGWEGINWARTHLWRYFSGLYSDEVAPGSASSESSEAESEDDGTDNDWVDVLFAEMMRLKTSGQMSKRFCSIEAMSRFLVRRGVAEAETNEIICASALSLLQRLDNDPDQGGARTWSKKLIYRQLQKLAPEIIEEPETPVQPPPNRRHKKSILRPSVGAGKGKKRILEAVESPEEDEEIDAPEEEILDVVPESPTKKRKLAFQAKPTASKTMNGALISPRAPLSTDAQLELIRKEGIANGRLPTSNLEAMIKDLMQAGT